VWGLRLATPRIPANPWSTVTIVSEPDLLRRLISATSGLQARLGTRRQDLRDAIQLVADALAQGSLAAIPPPREDGEPDPGAFLEQRLILSEALRRSPGADAPRNQVVVRSLGARVIGLEETLPPWALGRAVHRSYGPFVDADGTRVHVDQFMSAPFVKIIRSPDTEPFLLLPLGLTPRAGGELEVPAGSVWIAARLLSAESPAGFIGLRVRGGRLVFRAPVTFTGQNLFIDPAEEFSLGLDLDPPAGVAGGGFAGDAEAVTVGLPHHLELRFRPGAAIIERIDDLSAEVYGSALVGTRSAESPTYEAAVSHILVPFRIEPLSLSIASVTSSLFRPAGVGAVERGGWALPVTTGIAAGDLGPTAGTGAILFTVGPGLRAETLDVSGGPFRLGVTSMLLGPGELLVIATAARNSRATLVHELWTEREGRRSTITARFPRPFMLRYLASTSQRIEVVHLETEIDASLDRPVYADGDRLLFRQTPAWLVQSRGDAGGSFGVTAASPSASRPGSLALANGLLRTTAPKALRAIVSLDESGNTIGGTVTLTFGLHFIVPALPDPYAASFDLPGRQGDREPRVQVEVLVSWSGGAPAVHVRFRRTEGVDLAALLPSGLPLRPAGHEEGRFRAAFDARLHAVHESHRLLDLSGASERFGVAAGFRAPRPSLLAVSGLHLAFPGHDLRAFLLPQVQWEPVRTPLPIPPFPPRLVSEDGDGGPTLIGGESVEMVPVAPIPVVRAAIEAARTGQPAAILFTLPFGIRALALLPTAREVAAGVPPDSIDIIRHRFEGLTAARQITLRASLPDGLHGFAVQTRNALDGLGQRISALDFIEGFFNNRFGPTSSSPSVPVQRVDLSGYGESVFSEIAQPEVDPPGVSQVRFDVLVGRTAYEVVQVKSILWPCQSIVVRSITLQRTGAGDVVRHDTGWVAVTPGIFQVKNSNSVFHPGVVRGYYNIREIQDTRQFVTPAGAKLQAVYFDTDVAMEGVVRGHGRDGTGPLGEKVGLVPTQRHLGFVQHEPSGVPLSAAQLGALFQEQGPVGGPLDCEIRVAGSEHRMRVTSIAADLASGADFAVVAYGSPTLPAAGQWSVVRIDEPGTVNETEALPIDARRGVPLIRRGNTAVHPEANPEAYRYADPRDLLQGAAPSRDYAFLFAADVFRVLYPRPRILPHSRRFTSAVPPSLADPLCLGGTRGAFPRPQAAITFPSANYALEIDSERHLRLAPSPVEFTISDNGGVRQRKIMDTGTWRAQARYAAQAGVSRLSFRYDSAAVPAWRLTLGPSSVDMDLDPLGRVISVESTLTASSTERADQIDPAVRFSSILQPTQQLMTVFNDFGLPTPMNIEVTNPESPAFGWKSNFHLSMKDLPKIALGGLKDRCCILGPLGKVCGEINIGAAVETSLAGTKGEVFIEIVGEFQVPLPPFPNVLRGGGHLKFEIVFSTERETELTLVAAGVCSVHGENLVPILVDFEAAMRRGYVLQFDKNFQRYRPGLFLGMEVSATIASGAIGISFEWEGQALIGLDADPDYMRVEAKIEVTVQATMAYFLETGVELKTKYEERIHVHTLIVAGLLVGLGIVTV